MFKTSTSIIKAQIPGITLSHLLNFYKRELNYQSVSHTAIRENCLSFSNKTYKFVINRYANKFSSFSNGQIKITDTENEFIIQMQANMTRLFINTGIIAGAMALFFLGNAGFTLFSLSIGIVIFIVLSILGYAITMISFPVYFVNLRNKIQEELEAMQK